MPTLVHGETRINTTTTSWQLEPSITALADGGYLATWSDPATDSIDYIFTQRYNASGAKVGGETRINTSTAKDQSDPVVTGLANGGYVVAWRVKDGDGNSDIRVQRFDANGAKAGAESQVNTFATGSQDSPEITALKDGGYVVSWASGGQDGSDWGAYLQRYNASGVKVGGETRINTTTAGAQDGPTVTGLTDGGYLAVWEGNGSGDSSGIYAQRFNASGVKVGGETRVNSIIANDQTDPIVTVLKSGGYVVTWQTSVPDNDGNDDTEGPGDIYSQLFNASGMKIGGETRVNATTSGSQQDPRVTALADGGYVVVWDGNGVGDVDGIFVQRFNASGVKVGGETRVNTSTAGHQEFSSIAALADGGYVVTWESYDVNGQNPDIHSQRFDANGNKLSGLTGDALANTLTWSGANSVIIDGGAGNDILTGGIRNDHINGGTGNDSLNGGLGADRMTGGDGNDAYYVDNIGDIVSETNATAATGGTDLVSSYLTAYTLGSNVENLRLMATGAANGTGNGLNNLIYAGAGNNVLNGGSGSDTVSYAFAASAITASLETTAAQATGGSGSDTLLNVEHLTGSSYNDKLTGNSLTNTLVGGTGSDSLNGGSGNDLLVGGTGADTLVGGLGADRMNGEDGSDLYHVDNIGDIISETNATAATGGTDLVNSYLASYTLGSNIEDLRLMSSGAANGTGNGLNNLIYAGSGNNVLNGGSGSDTLSYANATASVSANLAVTTAQATGGSGTDTLLNFEHLTGSNYHDTLIGNALANTLSGGAGNDTLNGGAGNDLLIGGTGTDRLYGSTGTDRFDFNVLGESGLGALRDVIGDFKASEGDKIDLASLDANGQTALNDAFSFIGSSAFSANATGQLRFANGVIYGSTDADSAAEFEISLIGVATLSSTDVIL